MAPATPQSGHLEPGMVVTVEPGIYFSTYALNMFYLPSPVHSKYINVSVLEKYLPVGGVRIEDDILITPNGYENLTKAPKGAAMLEIIRTQGANLPGIRYSPSLTMPKNKVCTGANLSHNKEEPLVRAPGIPVHMSGAQGVKRASSLPASTPFKRTLTIQIPAGAFAARRIDETMMTIENLAGVNISIPAFNEQATKDFFPLSITGYHDNVAKAARLIKDFAYTKPGFDAATPASKQSVPIAHKNFFEDRKKMQGNEPICRVESTSPCAEKWHAPKSAGEQSTTSESQRQTSLRALQRENCKRVEETQRSLAAQRQAPFSASPNTAPAFVSVHPTMKPAAIPYRTMASAKHSPGSFPNQALADYQAQLHILEEINKTTVKAAKDPTPTSVAPNAGSGSYSAKSPANDALRDFEMQLRLLELHNQRRLQMAREDPVRFPIVGMNLPSSPKPANAPSDHDSEPIFLGERAVRRGSKGREEFRPFPPLGRSPSFTSKPARDQGVSPSHGNAALNGTPRVVTAVRCRTQQSPGLEEYLETTYG